MLSLSANVYRTVSQNIQKKKNISFWCADNGFLTQTELNIFNFTDYFFFPLPQ